MNAFRVVPHGPECMRDTRELVLARPTRWRCSPDLESERGGPSAAQPDLLPHPVRIVAVRAACRGIERVNRFVRNKLLDAVDLPTNGKHPAEGQHIVLRLIAVAVMRVRIDPQARPARPPHSIGRYEELRLGKGLFISCRFSGSP